MKPALLLLLPFLTTTMTASELFEIKIHSLDGSSFDMTSLNGKTVLFVNVASRCGFTKQYAALQELSASMRDKGLMVIGVPSNDFGAQEPGTAEEIQAFCTTKFAVDFPMTEKVSVKGADKHPLYQFLTKEHEEPKWNFHKYLVDKHGKVIASFPSKVTPDAPELSAAISSALALP